MPPLIRLVEHPGETVTFAEFCAQTDGPGIAVDGYVSGPSAWSKDGPHASFNHHEGGRRLFTRATCEQARLAVAHGLWDQMLHDGVPGAEVHVNDADPDVCTAVYVLGHPERLDDVAVERLVAAEGIIDTTAAFWCPPSVDADFLAALAWVYEPCFDARAAGRAADAPGLPALIEAVIERIEAHVDGRGGSRPAWGDFEERGRRGGVVAVVEHGPYARMALRRAGIHAVVAERRAGPCRHITLAKASPFAGPDLDRAYGRLNELERCGPDQRWGGSDLVGGSPRRMGTALPLDEILAVVADCAFGPRRPRPALFGPG